MDVTTLLNDWSAGRGPLHQKLAAALERAIRSGELPGGERLPSERSLAERLVVSRSTVVAAYAALVRAGMAESRHGSGTYVAPPRRPSGLTGGDPARPTTPLFQRLLAGEGPSDVISFASATVPLPAILREAMEATVNEGLSRLTAMPGHQPLGLRSLREAVAEMLSRRGVPSTAEQILITTGAHQALNLCAALLVRPGDWVAVEDPTYPGCIDAFAAAGGRLAPLDVDEEGLSLESVAAVLG
ncbi:MAG TPA: PLP-dependent aminotransferase family protein, partial [Acidimicrobiia bacterium]|nr:PLP-dependent aminotransferase family protein [Acidimicrobiia bacterium]